jgi:putative membrane protein
VLVLAIVLVVDCFPHLQSEDDDDHEDDQETPASYRYSSRLFDSDPDLCQPANVAGYQMVGKRGKPMIFCLTVMTTLTTKENRTPLSIVAAIIALSAIASLFLCWLVYFHAPTDVTGTHLLFLPSLNALLNALSAIALVIGFRLIRAHRVSGHRAAMFAAFVFSCLFLVTYITNHALHGDMRFQGAGAIRYIYFPLLISHIGLSVVALPMILITFFLSLTGRFPAHRRLARFTFPIWLYVSVTGVIVYAMLALYR